MNIVINGNLTPWQLGVAASMHRFAIIRAGRRTGKTILSVYLLLKHAIQHPGSLCWYCALDIATLNELVLPQLERICPPELWVKKNKQTRLYTLWNGSIIALKTLDSGDSLRGRGVDFMVLEEAAFAPHLDTLWLDILSPQLMGRGGRAMFISSPNGSNFFRRLEVQAMEEIRACGNSVDCEWSVHTGNIYDNPYIAREEIERKKKITPEDTWRAEFMGQYVDSVGTVYWEFSPTLNTKIAPPSGQSIYNVRGMDWGIDDETACVWLQAYPNGICYVADEYSANNLDAQTQAKRILAFNNMPVKYNVLDSACWARDPSLSSVAKRFATAGLQAYPATKDLDGTISDVKGLIATRKILISDRCVKLLKAIEEWQFGSHEPDILAAFRYGIASLVKNGKLLPPIRTANPVDILDFVKMREKEAKDSERALLAMQRGRSTNNDMVFRFYNGLGERKPYSR